MLWPMLRCFFAKELHGLKADLSFHKYIDQVKNVLSEARIDLKNEELLFHIYVSFEPIPEV